MMVAAMPPTTSCIPAMMVILVSFVPISHVMMPVVCPVLMMMVEVSTVIGTTTTAMIIVEVSTVIVVIVPAVVAHAITVEVIGPSVIFDWWSRAPTGVARVTTVTRVY